MGGGGRWYVPDNLHTTIHNTSPRRLVATRAAYVPVLRCLGSTCLHVVLEPSQVCCLISGVCQDIGRTSVRGIFRNHGERQCRPQKVAQSLEHIPQRERRAQWRLLRWLVAKSFIMYFLAQFLDAPCGVPVLTSSHRPSPQHVITHSLRSAHFALLPPPSAPSLPPLAGTFCHLATLPLYHFAHMHTHTQTHKHTNTDGELLVVILGGDGFIHNVRQRGEERTGAKKTCSVYACCTVCCTVVVCGVRCDACRIVCCACC